MKYDTEAAYTGKFEIRNLIVNGVMWTGTETQTTSLFPDVRKSLRDVCELLVFAAGLLRASPRNAPSPGALRPKQDRNPIAL